MTIAVEESFSLSISDSSGKSVSNVTWSVQDSDICTVSGSGKVTGLASGMTQVTAAVDGQTFSCIVRVK